MRASGRASTGTIEMKIKKKNIRRKRKKKAKNALKSELDGWTVPVRRAERVAPKIKLNVKRKN